MSEKTVFTSSGEATSAMFGAFDANAKIIESAFDVRLSNSSKDGTDAINVTGDEENVEKAARALEYMKHMCGGGETVSEQSTEYVVSLVKDNSDENPENLGRDVICITSRGKTIKAKTVGQRKYVDTIKKNTIVLGLGPAGTGKTFLAVAMAVEALRNKSIKSPVIRDAVAMEKIRHAAEELSRGDLNAVEQTGYIHVILGTVLKQLDLQESHLPQDVALPEKLLFYVNEHYKEDMTPAGVAQALGYSANHLSKCFRAHFQIGMGSYINTLRLKNAVMLMREKKMSITDCAMESGFGSLRTFYRAFEEEFGCTPREYLKQDPAPV